MKTIGIISDTHGTFDNALRRFLAPCDEIWHAGDIGSIEIADQIAAYRPLKAVWGNIDGGNTRVAYRQWQSFACEDVRVLMTHIGGYPGRYDKGVQEKMSLEKPGILITGHSHILKVMFDKKNDLLFINPGAAGNYGFHHVRTAVRLNIDGARISDLEVGEWER